MDTTWCPSFLSSGMETTSWEQNLWDMNMPTYWTQVSLTHIHTHKCSETINILINLLIRVEVQMNRVLHLNTVKYVSLHWLGRFDTTGSDDGEGKGAS